MNWKTQLPKGTAGMFVDAQPNSWQGVLIWSFCMTIAQATIYFIVLSRSSQAPFACDVAEKCQLAEMLKSSLW